MLSDALTQKLKHNNIEVEDETSLREILERHIDTYTLIKLAPWPARRWKCQYRLLIGDAIHDAQSAADAYALGILAILTKKASS